VNAAFLLAATLCLGTWSAVAAEDHAALEQRMRQQLAERPGDLDARFQLARALSWQNRYNEALAEYSRLLEARPENADFLLGLAQVHLWRGEPAMSLAPLRKARALTPAYEDVWRTEIQALLALGDAERLRQARLIRDDARNRFPKSDWTYAGLDDLPQSAQDSVPKAPAAVAADRYEWEVGFSDEALSRGLPNWRSRHLVGEWHGPDRKALYAGLRETERYALRDREAHVGGVLPLNTDTQLQLEAGFSDSHRVLAKRYVLLQMGFRPAAGWALGAGWRRSDYDAGLSKVLNFSVDRYIGAERFGYTLFEGGPDGSGLSPSHRLQWAHFYGERDWVGITLTQGRETEYAPNGAFLTSKVSGASLSGRHGIAPRWALVWDAGSLRQGDFYTRSGVQLGLRHAF
jgi:YaiO family outer membrane protein